MLVATPPAPPAIVHHVSTLNPRQAASSTASRPVCVRAHRRAAWPPNTTVRNATRAAVGRAVGGRVTSITAGARYGTWFANTSARAPFRVVTVSIARASGCGQVYPSPVPAPVRCCTADPSRSITTGTVRVEVRAARPKMRGKRPARVMAPRKRSW